MQVVLRRAALVVLALAVPGAALAAASGPSLKLVGSARAYQGKPYTVSVTSKRSCALTVRYSDGAKQTGLLAAKGANDRVTWKWTLPQVTAPGPALLSARCGGATGTRKITVVGSLIPPKIVVAKSGWSVRYTGARGATRQLRRPAEEHVSERQRHEGERPGELRARRQQARRHGHAAGVVDQRRRDVQLRRPAVVPGHAPIAKLEFVIIVGAREKAQKMPRPGLDNVRCHPRASSIPPGRAGCRARS